MLPRYFGIYNSNVDLSFWREPHGASLNNNNNNNGATSYFHHGKEWGATWLGVLVMVHK